MTRCGTFIISWRPGIFDITISCHTSDASADISGYYVGHKTNLVGKTFCEQISFLCVFYLIEDLLRFINISLIQSTHSTHLAFAKVHKYFTNAVHTFQTFLQTLTDDVQFNRPQVQVLNMLKCSECKTSKDAGIKTSMLNNVGRLSR